MFKDFQDLSKKFKEQGNTEQKLCKLFKKGGELEFPKEFENLVGLIKFLCMLGKWKKSAK